MLTLKLNKAKSMFFDRAGIDRRIDAATKRNFERFGGRARKTAQFSMRYRKGVSAPGTPPSAHKTTLSRKLDSKGKPRTISLLREYIFYGYDAPKHSVVIGPVLLNGQSGRALPALEYGGMSDTKDQGKWKSVFIRPRPFMNPAGKLTEKALPEIWRDSIK